MVLESLFLLLFSFVFALLYYNQPVTGNAHSCLDPLLWTILYLVLSGSLEYGYFIFICTERLFCTKDYDKWYSYFFSWFKFQIIWGRSHYSIFFLNEANLVFFLSRFLYRSNILILYGRKPIMGSLFTLPASNI